MHNIMSLCLLCSENCKFLQNSSLVRHQYSAIYLDDNVCSAPSGMESTPPMCPISPTVVGGERVQRAQGAICHKDNTPSTAPLPPIRSTSMNSQCPIISKMKYKYCVPFCSIAYARSAFKVKNWKCTFHGYH